MTSTRLARHDSAARPRSEPSPLDRRRSLELHLTVYGLVVAMIVAWWAIMTACGVAWTLWPVLPALVWGIAVAIHVRAVLWSRRRGQMAATP